MTGPGTASGWRQDWAVAAGAVCDLLAATDPEQLDRPTPCTDFDVRRLAGHLVGVGRRTLATASGTPDGSPHVVTDVPDAALAAAYRDLVAPAGRAWSARADAEPVRAPWGVCSTAEALRGFTVETAVHAWDLAVATGRDVDQLDGVATRCLVAVDETVPVRLRGMMYDEARDVPLGASPLERLAAALGRDVGAWRRR